MGNNFKIGIKRLTACLLSATITLGCAPIQSFAIGGNASGDNSTGVITGAGGDFSANISTDPRESGKIGVRLSLVDNNNPSEVISVDENGNPMVLDLLYTTKLQFTNQAVGNYLSNLKGEFTYSSVKTQDLAYQKAVGGTGPNIVQKFYDDVITYKHPEKEEASQFFLSSIPPWLIHTGSYESRGEDFVAWCKQNEAGYGVIGDSGLLYTTNIFGVSVPVKVYRDEEGFAFVEPGGGLDKWTNSYSPEITDAEVFLDMLRDLDIAYRDFDKAIERKGLEYATGRLAGALVKGKVAINGLMALGEYNENESPTPSEKWIEIYNASVEYNIDYYINLLNQEYNTEEAIERGTTEDYRSKDIVVKVVTDSVQNLGQTTEQVTDPNALSDVAHLHMLLGLKTEADEGGHTYYRLQTESMRQAAIINEDIPLKEATEDWVLLVEPIMWLTIFPENTTSYGIHSKVYGTVSNIMDAFRYDSEGKLQEWAEQKTFNWKAFAKVWGALYVKNEGFTFANGQKLAPPMTYGLTIGNYYHPGLLSDTNRWKDGVKAGWGCNVYWKNDIYGISSGIDTWDKINNPNGEPGPAPDPTNLSEETAYKENSKDFIITKWYVARSYGEDGIPIDYVVDVQTRKDTPHKVNILNEGTADTDMFWEVEKWATGKDALVPEDGDLSTTFEQYFKMNRGSKGGVQPIQVEIKPEDTDKVLYVKLVSKEIVPVGDLDIIKVKDKNDGSTTVDRFNGNITDGRYNATENGWVYIEDIQTPDTAKDVKNWEDVPEGTHGATSEITVKEDTKTIYIHYKEGETNIVEGGKQPLVLEQDELSHGYTLKNLHTDGSLAYIQEYFISKNFPMKLCDGHECGGEDCSGNHGRSQNHVPKIEDNKYKLSVTSSNNNPTFIADYIQDDSSWSIFNYKGISGGNTDKLLPNAKFLLYRNKTKDLVTLYPDKNDSTTRGLLAHIGIDSVGTMPQTNRVAQTGSGKFNDTFNVQFSEADGYDRTLSWKWICSYTDSVEDSGTWDSTFVSGHTITDLNNSYTFDNNVEERYELGTVGNGTTAPQSKRSEDFASVFYNNPFVSVQQDGDIKFYPYIKMVYNDRDSESRLPVLVTSTNTSTIGAFTKVESGVWKNGQKDDDTVEGVNPLPNVTLDSTQWSTHKNSLNFMADNGVDDKKSVLPGGAIFDVSMSDVDLSYWGGLQSDKPTTSTKLGYRVWQTCIEDARLGLLAPDSTAPSVSEAKQKVIELDNSIKVDIPKYGLVQMITKGAVDYRGYMGTFTTKTEYNAVVNGGNWNGIPLSTDAKYYLKLISAGAGSEDEFNSTVTNFDVLKGGIKQQTLYTVGSDTEGNVYVLLNGTEIGRIGPTETISQLLSKNSEIRLLDENTKVVTNYVNSIDRNIGSNRNGKAWYNEAFDGVNVLYSYLSYDIGFGSGIEGSPGAGGKGTARRSAVLDTKLTGKLDNKSDLYNFNEEKRDEKVRSSMILTGQTGIEGGLMAPTGEMGTLTLKNGNTITVKLGNMPIFAYSKMFYLPNANVSDLN